MEALAWSTVNTRVGHPEDVFLVRHKERQKIHVQESIDRRKGRYGDLGRGGRVKQGHCTDGQSVAVHSNYLDTLQRTEPDIDFTSKDRVPVVDVGGQLQGVVQGLRCIREAVQAARLDGIPNVDAAIVEELRPTVGMAQDTGCEDSGGCCGRQEKHKTEHFRNCATHTGRVAFYSDGYRDSLSGGLKYN